MLSKRYKDFFEDVFQLRGYDPIEYFVGSF